MPTGHAKLSPSAAHRWMNCPGSVKLIGDESSTTTQAAMMGTAAHAVIERMITNDEHDARQYHRFSALVKAAGDEDVELYPPETAIDLSKREGWFLFIVDDKMVDGIQCTIDEVDRLREEMFEPEIYPERYFDGSWLDSRFGGTGDVTLVEMFGWAHLVDHKNGYLLVEVQNEDGSGNEQLLNYAVFVLHEHPEVEGVRVTISQPHGSHADGPVRTAEFTRAQILEFQERMVRAAAETDKPNAPLRAGDWCTFCPVKTRCKEFDESVLAEALNEFSTADDPPPGLNLPTPTNSAELARKGRWVPLIEGWTRQIMSTIQQELENGNAVEGFKLVRGRANRKWIAEETDTSGIIGAFEKLGLSRDELLTEPELKSVAQVEKLGPKGRTKEIRAVRAAIKAKVAELSFKPDGKITVARAGEAGEEVSPFSDAASEFDDADDFGP